MYQIILYKKQNGECEIEEYLRDLGKRSVSDKDSRIKFKKINTYFEILRQYGTRVGEPVTKHIVDDIWELRPHKERLFYFYWKDDTFVILHHFTKASQKTPTSEIEKAKRNLKDFRERSGDNEKY